MKRKGLAVLLSLTAILMTLVFLPTTAQAEEPLTFTLDAAGMITGVSGDVSGIIEIPSTVDGIPVKGIGDRVFYYNEDITAVVLPEGLETIGNEAFWGCTSLTSVTLPSTLQSIGSDGLRNTGLTNVVVPEGVTTVGAAAFMNCSELTEVSLPSTLTSLGGSAFAYCTSLASVNIPQGVTTLELYTFLECDSLESLTIPDSVTKMKMYAIDNCDRLSEIILHENVTLELYAIYGCNALKSITIPAGKPSASAGCISECRGLETLIFAEGTTSIPVDFLSHCPNIKQIVVPASVTYFSAKLSYSDIPDARIHYLGTQESWEAVKIDHKWLDGLVDIEDIHYITVESKPSTCAAEGYENKRICSADGCGYIYDSGTVLPVSEEHAQMDTTTGKCTICQEDIAVAKVDYINGTTAYIAAETLSSELYECYHAATFTMLKDAQIQQLYMVGGTFDLNGCTVTGCLDVRDTVTILDSAGGGQMLDEDFPVLVNGYAIAQGGIFDGAYADFKVDRFDNYCLDLSQYSDPADLSVYVAKSDKLLYDLIRLPAGYVLEDDNHNVLPRNAVLDNNAEVITVANCRNHQYELRLDGNDTIRGICKHCLHRNGVVKLSAEDCLYDGQPHGADKRCAQAENWEVTLTHYDSDGRELENLPVDAGTYTAKLTCKAFGQEQSIEVTYTISLADIADHVRIYWEPTNYDAQPKQVELTKPDSDAHCLSEGVDYTITYAPVDSADTLQEGLPVNAGDYKVTVKGIGNYTGTVTEIYIGKDETGTPFYKQVMEIHPAWLEVEEDSVTAMDKVYDGSTDAEVPMVEYRGAVPSDDVMLRVSGEFADTKAGTDKTVLVTYTLYGEDASNYEVFGPEEVKANISCRSLYLNADDQSIAYGEKISQQAYDVAGVLNGQTAAVTLTPSTDVITENGTIDPTVTVTADGEDVTDNYNVITVPGKLTITLDTSVVDSTELENVNHSQMDQITEILETAEELLKSEALTSAQKENLTKTKEKAEALLERIEESVLALAADEVLDVLDITSETVKPEDKETIEKAIQTIEAAMKTYSGNYTAADKKNLQDQIDVLKACLDALEKQETETKPDQKPGNPVVPSTGDESNIALWLCLMAVTACGVIVVIVLSVKKKR